MIQVKDLYPVSSINPNLFGFTIDESNTDPLASVQYTDSAIFYSKGSVNWDSSNVFKNIKPCLFSNGAVVGYLNKNDFTKFENGTDADISSGSAGDVMIEIPKMAWYISKVGTLITVKLFVGDGAAAVDSRFKYFAHSRSSLGDRSNIYVGAYLGYSLSSKLRSLSGYTPTSSITQASMRSLAQANGAGYQFMTFFAHTLTQILFVLRYGNRNSQSALGMGYVNESYTTHANTGGTNKSGMNYGESGGHYQTKFMGIEDIWGNLFVRLEGIIKNTSNAMVATYTGFNDTGSGFLYSIAATASSGTDYYTKYTAGDASFGFLPINSVPSGSLINYCDLGFITSDSAAAFGVVVGNNSSGAASAGIFAFSTRITTYSGPYDGTRLCYI